MQPPKLRNQIELLDRHEKIGIDIDQTLIGGPCSLMLQEYIRTHREKEYHLITFRFGRDLELVPQDLAQNWIPMEWFASLNGSPREHFERYFEWLQLIGHLKHRPKKLERALRYHKIDSEELETVARSCTLWKGLKCKELGCTALVDDLVEYVLPGCQLHGVEFVHSYYL